MKPEEATEKDREAAHEHAENATKVIEDVYANDFNKTDLYRHGKDGFLAGILHERAKGVERERLRQAIRFGAHWQAPKGDDKCYSWDELVDQFLSLQQQGEGK